MRTFTDEQLIDQIQAGNPAAFAQLYQRYKNGIFAFCFRLLRDRDDALDAAQEIFVKIHNRLHSLNDTSSFRAWMFTIARNEVYAVLRRRKQWNDASEEVEQVWADETPLDIVIGGERTELVQRLLGKLKPEYREVLLLREYEQFSYAEIAEATGNSESSVKSRLFKARKSLMLKLTPYLEEWKER